ncbi:hypothetical protein RchiOBHm_Chr7g0232871 [Rosa chinensis]|uniref:Uncharacterized protein n=1 Tax=Rosa chinensis TaxID=74649 RepID=A0A2P6PG17_ROSCH|nr:hypothetical protein RchiOBHm_Chr7g0232871 [Rosa chinensis]
MAKCIKDAEPRWAKNSNNCNGRGIHGTPVTRNMKDCGVGLEERMESKLQYSSLWMQVLCMKTG